jgi:methionine-gamma-lyase
MLGTNLAISLGVFDTLMSCSGASTSRELSEEAPQEAGISRGLA